ncbi:YkgJ family cysteine cluster protein [Desulfobacca acetoxidans]
MTTKPKFTGKIRANPLIALERGGREVMLSLWKEYLSELLDLNPKSGRRRLLTERIEQAGDFDRLYQDWNDLTTPERADRWLLLVQAAKAVVQQTQETCLRCGECCTQGAPVLMMADLSLFQDDLLHWTEVYTLRRGEKSISPKTGEEVVLAEERLKVKESSKGGHCLFFAPNPNRCLIYDQRPQECRKLPCYRAELEKAPDVSGFLNRQALFGEVTELWEFIATHEERCAINRLATALQDLLEQKAAATEVVFDILHFDHYLRQMLLQEWQVPAASLDLLLGRPVNQIIQQFDLQAEMTPEGVFQLERLR